MPDETPAKNPVNRTASFRFANGKLIFNKNPDNIPRGDNDGKNKDTFNYGRTDVVLFETLEGPFKVDIQLLDGSPEPPPWPSPLVSSTGGPVFRAIAGEIPRHRKEGSFVARYRYKIKSTEPGNDFEGEFEGDFAC